MPGKFIFLFGAVLLSVQCSGRLALPRADDHTRIVLAVRLNQQISPSRLTPLLERSDVVRRIDARVNKAAIEVCKRAFEKSADSCFSRLSGRRLSVLSASTSVNAYAESKLAFVLAHEYSHGLMKHIRTTQVNAAIGTIAGAIAGGLAGVDVNESADIGARTGARAYSKPMELEADHLAMFIFAEAGYDIMKSGDFFLRMIKAGVASRFYAFMTTHPTDSERVQRLIATERLIRSGGMKKPQVH